MTSDFKRKLYIPKYAKTAARNALKKRKSLPKSKRFGLDRNQASKLGINSGVERAKQISSSRYVTLKDAKRIAAFYNRFKSGKSSKIDGAINLWGGRAFGRKAATFVKKARR